MNKRWTKRIDVYMGVDVKAALQFGKREVQMYYRTEPKPAADKPLLVADNS